MAFRTLDGLAASGKRVLLRADLNVPMADGAVGDLTRLERLTPTIRELSALGARVVVISHFDRPKGKRVAAMSLRPVADALAKVLGHPVAFADDCVGEPARAAVAAMRNGDVLVLENTRFHAGEEDNDPAFARELAAHADLYVSDAFSVAHRAHASTHAVAQHLPAHAGRLMQAELEALETALGDPVRPVCAIVGGAKISTKLDLLANMIARVDTLVIGGAMANTFLAAQGWDAGKSLQEKPLHETARDVMRRAKETGCDILLPTDAVVARVFKAHAPTETVSIDAIPPDAMILDVGPATTYAIIGAMKAAKTLVWNGPLGAFEIPPFDTATVAVARAAALMTETGALRSIGGGGDTVAALRAAGVVDRMSYVSTAGGAFLEWLEGKELPGVRALHVA